MKKILSFIFLSVYLFSYEISFNKEFSKVVVPDLLSTYVSISIENKDENFIREKLEKFNLFIDKNKSVIKKNGNSSISPKYTYYKNKQEFEGYVGRLNYEIRAVSAKNMNLFIGELIALKKELKVNNNKLDISNISWLIGEDLQRNSLDDLRFKSILWIENHAKELSKKLSKDCVVRKVNIDLYNINNDYRSSMRAEMTNYSVKSLKAVAPVKDDKKIKINPNFLLECK